MACGLTCGLALVSSWSGHAGAQPDEEAVRFQYQAPGACPDAASFTARVRLRTQRGREAEAEELARTFTIRVLEEARGFVGDIAFLDDGGAPVSRRVGGEQCEPVVDSLALITALALDATLREAEPSSSAAREPTSSPLPGSEKAPAPVATARLASPVPAQRPAERWLRSARVGVVGGYETTIEALPLGLLGQLDWRSGLSLRFAAHFASSEHTLGDGRSAELRVLGLESSGCYAPLRVDELVLWPCAWLDLGTLRAEGKKSAELPTASGKAIFWASVGPELRVAWEPDVPFWLELRGTLGFPLVVHGFAFDQPEAKVFEVPRVTAGAGVATGVRFW